MPVFPNGVSILFARFHPPRRRFRAFTLVELMVVVAIIGILMIVAMPAYNNYSTKSKFSEVVLATAPTKTAIATCAGTGDCISGGVIALGGTATTTVPGSTATITPASYANSNNINTAAIFAYAYAAYLAQGQTAANAYASAANLPGDVTGVNFVGDHGGSACLAFINQPSNCSGSFAAIPWTTVNSYMNSAANPYYTALYGQSTTTATVYTPANLPCVGGAGCSPPTKYAASVSYDPSGVITATAQTTSGLKAETYVLIPSYSSGRVDWSASGTCKTRAGGALC